MDIFKEGPVVYQLPTLSEIQEYARKNYDQLWDEYKRVLNPQRSWLGQRYLAGWIWSRKCWHKANGWEKQNEFARRDYPTLVGAKPQHWSREEIRRSVDFLISKTSLLENICIRDLRRGQDSTLAGRLAQLFMEEMRARNGRCLLWIYCRSSYGDFQADEKQMHRCIQPDVGLVVRNLLTKMARETVEATGTGFLI